MGEILSNLPGIHQLALINDILRPLASCEIELKSLQFDDVHSVFDDYCKNKYDGCTISATVLNKFLFDFEATCETALLFLII